MKIKVKNMKSSNGNDVPNQFIVETDEGEYFWSYRSVIAFRPFAHHRGSQAVTRLNLLHESIRIMTTEGQLPTTYLDKNKWDYSTTTEKYRNQFLGETKKETEAKIKSGEYALVDLN